MSATGSLFLQSVRPPRDWDDVDETASSITRARIFEAMARAVAERGYAKTSVAYVVGAGRISRRTFYAYFQDKEHCFVEMYRTGFENGLAQIDAAVRALEEPDWRTRLCVSLETYLESPDAEAAEAAERLRLLTPTLASFATPVLTGGRES
jgi:AcrR family transcriptional regulator